MHTFRVMLFPGQHISFHGYWLYLMVSVFQLRVPLICSIKSCKVLVRLIHHVCSRTVVVTETNAW